MATFKASFSSVRPSVSSTELGIAVGLLLHPRPMFANSKIWQRGRRQNWRVGCRPKHHDLKNLCGQLGECCQNHQQDQRGRSWKKRQSNHLVDRPMGKQQLQVELTLIPKRLASGSILHDIAPLQQKTQRNERKVRNEGSRCIVGHSS